MDGHNSQPSSDLSCTNPGPASFFSTLKKSKGGRGRPPEQNDDERVQPRAEESNFASTPHMVPAALAPLPSANTPLHYGQDHRPHETVSQNMELTPSLKVDASSSSTAVTEVPLIVFF